MTNRLRRTAVKFFLLKSGAAMSALIACLSLAVCPRCAGAEPALSGREVALRAYNADTSRDARRHTIMVVERDGMRLTRELEMLTKKFPPDERTLIRFLEPPDVRNNRYLTWSWEDPDKRSDMWVFLPSENLVRRISDGGKKAAFMRSDLANEDMEKRSVRADKQDLLREEAVDGVRCFVVEYVPLSNEDSNYSRRVAWIRSDIWHPVRIEYYDKRNELLKTAHYGGYEQISGVWSYTRMAVETPRRNSKTLIQVQRTEMNTGLADSDFEQGSLKR